MHLKFTLKSTVFATICLFAYNGNTQELKLNFELNPAGDFSVKSNTILGSVKKYKGGYMAENINVPITSLKSGIELRDQHIYKRLEANKFPNVILLKAIATKGKFTGILKVKNMKKKIHGVYKTEGKNLVGSFKLKMSDFKLPEASYLGVGVEDEFELVIKAPLSSVR